jgi:hypothetical protein
MDELIGQAFGRNIEMLQGTLGLRPPQARRRHADVAEAVALQPGGTAVGRVIGHVRLPKSSLSKYGSVHPSKDLRVFEAAHTFSSPLEAP